MIVAKFLRGKSFEKTFSTVPQETRVWLPHLWQKILHRVHALLQNIKGDGDDRNFHFDVTLACEDGQMVEAHKVILAGSGH